LGRKRSSSSGSGSGTTAAAADAAAGAFSLPFTSDLSRLQIAPELNRKPLKNDHLSTFEQATQSDARTVSLPILVPASRKANSVRT